MQIQQHIPHKAQTSNSFFSTKKKYKAPSGKQCKKRIWNTKTLFTAMHGFKSKKKKKKTARIEKKKKKMKKKAPWLQMNKKKKKMAWIQKKKKAPWT